MNTKAIGDAAPEQTAEDEATLNRYLAEMEQMQKDIAANRRETDQLRAETEVMLKNTLTLLNLR